MPDSLAPAPYRTTKLFYLMEAVMILGEQLGVDWEDV